MLTRLVKIIVQYVKIAPDQIKPEMNLRTDLGLTSLSVMNMIVEIEDEFGVEIDDRQIMKFQTLADVVEYLEENAD